MKKFTRIVVEQLILESIFPVNTLTYTVKQVQQSSSKSQLALDKYTKPVFRKKWTILSRFVKSFKEHSKYTIHFYIIWKIFFCPQINHKQVKIKFKLWKC